MISRDNEAIFVVLPKDLAARFDRLKEVDGLIYSKSRVARECIQQWLHNVEQRAGVPFPAPTKQTSGRKKLRPA